MKLSETKLVYNSDGETKSKHQILSNEKKFASRAHQPTLNVKKAKRQEPNTVAARAPLKNINHPKQVVVPKTLHCAAEETKDAPRLTHFVTKQKPIRDRTAEG